MDLMIDGNGLANVGFEAYDDSIRGGSWRTQIERVAVVGVSHGANATAIKLGTGVFPNFAHDTRIDGCYLQGAARGAWGAGAKYALSQTTLFQLSEAACYAPQGSAWTVSQCIFSQNGWDFAGSNIQQADFSGCWFEDSKSGIYRASRAHSVSFVGCFLHTANPHHMMDFGDAAGYHFVGGHFIPEATKSPRIVNVNFAANGAVLGQSIPLTYAASGAEVPLILAPAQTGTEVVRSTSAELVPGQAVVLALGRGVFFVGLNVSRATSPDVRWQASYTAFLFDGDDEAVQLIAQHKRDGDLQCVLAPSNNRVTLTNMGSDVVKVFISGSGVVN
jgi:hypothetical protein